MLEAVDKRWGKNRSDWTSAYHSSSCSKAQRQTQRMVCTRRARRSQQEKQKKKAKNIDEWMDPQELQATLTDGLAIHCPAEKYGLALSIWTKNPNISAWDRHTFAPKFSTDGIAGLRQKRNHCHLCSKDDTIQLYLHAPKSQRVPKPWPMKTAADLATIIIDLICTGKHIQSKSFHQQPVNSPAAVHHSIHLELLPVYTPMLNLTKHPVVISDLQWRRKPRQQLTPKQPAITVFIHIDPYPQNLKTTKMSCWKEIHSRRNLSTRDLTPAQEPLDHHCRLSRSLVKKKPHRFNKASACLSHLLQPSVDDFTESKKSINGPIQSPPLNQKSFVGRVVFVTSKLLPLIADPWTPSEIIISSVDTPTTSKQTPINSADSNCNPLSLAMR